MKGKYVVLGLVVVVMLAGAAFMGGRYMNKSAGADAPQGIVMPDGEVVSFGDGASAGVPEGADVQSFAVKVEPAPELPPRQPDVMGQLKRVEDNSLFVGTGDMMITITSSSDGDNQVDMPEAKGPEVEVVVTQDTVIYREDMQNALPEPGGEAPEVVQQHVEEITLEDVGERGAISAWGEKRGDRIVAEVVVYMGF